MKTILILLKALSSDATDTLDRPVTPVMSYNSNSVTSDTTDSGGTERWGLSSISFLRYSRYTSLNLQHRPLVRSALSDTPDTSDKQLYQTPQIQ